MPKHKAINQALSLIFEGISQLKKAFPNREFTIDGRLVGDIGEVIAALEYDIRLHDTAQPDHDADTKDGRRGPWRWVRSLIFTSVCNVPEVKQ